MRNILYIYRYQKQNVRYRGCFVCVYKYFKRQTVYCILIVSFDQMLYRIIDSAVERESNYID